ncbi:metabotropic glutamate receptor 5 [Caerostris extrusa]|uniref:Metabotropic glutamate receptor 5 n=1 Tax=Caerostris extrusa TaxID=172846 RepID=A0AAV4R6H0_CAEEX|nr:metabotropic glutamate receptor 5 [Caerostris extrusa]
MLDFHPPCSVVVLQNNNGKKKLLNSDGWSDRNDVTEEYEKEAHGGISIRIHSTYDRSFDPYYFSLKPHNNSRNPWFREFWEYRFNCSLPNGSGKYNKTCSGKEDLRERYKQDTKMSFVKKAIYTMAYGLRHAEGQVQQHGAVCGDAAPQRIPVPPVPAQRQLCLGE